MILYFFIYIKDNHTGKVKNACIFNMFEKNYFCLKFFVSNPKKISLYIKKVKNNENINSTNYYLKY